MQLETSGRPGGLVGTRHARWRGRHPEVAPDLSNLFLLNSGGTLAKGSATVTFASTPAIYIRAQ